jgi:endoglucanase
VALSNFGEWSDTASDFDLDTSLINARYATTMPPGTTHFVIDTSRNGQGPWDASSYGLSDPQDWCNPPDRGLGLRPSADTGSELLDAYLWIKTPGESDGECNRGEEFDPVRGYTNPPAGAWFEEQVLELMANAVPAL